MNASLFTADCNTHIKVVVIALLAAIAFTLIAISTDVGDTPESRAVATNELLSGWLA
jgi:hypothetical protein